MLCEDDTANAVITENKPGHVITKAREFSFEQHEDVNGFNMRSRNYSSKDKLI